MERTNLIPEDLGVPRPTVRIDGYMLRPRPEHAGLPGEEVPHV